jgi:hypothetical protein
MGTFKDIKPGLRLPRLGSSELREIVQTACYGRDVINLGFPTNGRVSRLPADRS